MKSKGIVSTGIRKTCLIHSQLHRSRLIVSETVTFENINEYVM